VLLALSEASCDDLLRESIEKLITLGEVIHPSKGQARELQGITLELTNPRARLSRSETRGRIFSALGELCWYLSGTNTVEPISYYLSHYRTLGEGDKVYGGYGPRLFNFDGVNQIEYVIKKLRDHPYSRQAVIQLFDHEDVVRPHKDVPCTCTFQFLVREGGLHLVTHMRSSDAYLGLSHDIFSFTMIQEIVAKSIGASLGSYIHMVGSFHLYEINIAKAEAFLAEGWQSGEYHMPEMPSSDPWPGIAHLLSVESSLRNGNDPAAIVLSDEPYWADLERVLVIFSLVKAQRLVDAHRIRESFAHPAYDAFATDRIDPL
jgi:thymidylate synthase